MLHTFPLAGTRPRGKTDEEDKALEAELLSDEKEVRNALRAGARVIGVNNRNLKDFSVNTDNSRRLRELIPVMCCLTQAQARVRLLTGS